MRSYVVPLVVGGILISVTFGCLRVPADQKPSSKSLGVIQFPDFWVRQEPDGRQRVVNDSVHYVVRKKAGELIFAVKQGFDGSLFGKDVTDFPVKVPPYDYYADNYFAVSVDGQFRVRNGSAAEWAEATKPVHSYRFIQTWENRQFTERGITYNGKLFAKTGDSWGNEGSLVSPNSRWIVVFSFTSTDKPHRSLLPILGGGNGPSHGQFFIDVYDITSGDKVIAHSARFGEEGGIDPSLLFGGSVWIESQYLIVPLNFYLQDCLLIIMPERS